MEIREWSVVLAGVAHFGMVAVGALVPRTFGWKDDLARLTPMNRRLFWVYGLFIVMTNVGFGVVSLVYPVEIAAGKGVADAFALLLGLYWTVRLVVQLFVFRKEWMPGGVAGFLARHFLGVVILLMAVVYLASFARGVDL